MLVLLDSTYPIHQVTPRPQDPKLIRPSVANSVLTRVLLPSGKSRCLVSRMSGFKSSFTVHGSL